MSKSYSNTKVMAMSAMFTALITVATAFIKVPHPFGYTHAGDVFVYLSACNLPTPYGIIASALGGGLADLISGYPQWILPTMIIKALNAVPFVLCRYFLKKGNKDIKIVNKYHYACSHNSHYYIRIFCCKLSVIWHWRCNGRTCYLVGSANYGGCSFCINRFRA